MRNYDWFLRLTGVAAQSGDEPSPGKCVGGNPCLGTKAGNDLNDPVAVNFWYNSTDHQCSVLPLTCLVNTSVAFSDQDQCRVSCGGWLIISILLTAVVTWVSLLSHS